jgi:hypothetical protein
MMQRKYAYARIIFILFNVLLQNNGAQQLASEATVFIVLEDVNDEIPLFTEREQERVLEGEPIGTIVTRVNAIDRDGTFPNNQVRTILYLHDESVAVKWISMKSLNDSLYLLN